MNQEKIGKFIAQLRKEKKLTQQELATKLGITDRAISHWENGRSMPDVSIFQKLCEILDISVNELISGEKISKANLVTKSDENIINTLNDSKKHKKEFKLIITMLIGGIIILFSILILNNRNEYPHINLYNIGVQASSSNKYYNLNKIVTIDNRTIYYYGVDYVEFCDKDDVCFKLKEALVHKQIFLAEIKQYLEKQVKYDNYQVMRLYDGGTSIFKKSGFLVMFCNTIKGNKDIYIGNEEMLDNLNGEYCGHEKNQDESYIRTYKVISSSINKEDREFNDVTLKQNNGKTTTVLINNSYLLIPGHTYEFTFLTFDQFEDTIENIFKYSTLLKVVETDKKGNSEINEEIFINKEDNNISELNEIDNVRMYIVDGTLTKKGARVRITDFSSKQYVYGLDYYIEKKDGEWKKLEATSSDAIVLWDMKSHTPDINGILEFDINWEYYYGELTPGRYRIVKPVYVEYAVCKEKACNEYLISVEFDIK